MWLVHLGGIDEAVLRNRISFLYSGGLTRLYRYTAEFGLIRDPDGLRIYGSGILSSKSESIHSLESAAPNRIGFDLERIMRTRYRIDTYQKTYFVVDSFEQLFDAPTPDFAPIYAQLAQLDSIPAATCGIPIGCSTAGRAKAGCSTAMCEMTKRKREREVGDPRFSASTQLASAVVYLRFDAQSAFEVFIK